MNNTMDYKAIKVARRSENKPTVADYDAAIETEKKRLVEAVVRGAELEAEEYRVMHSPYTAAQQAKLAELKFERNALMSVYDSRRHLAKLMSMKYFLEHPGEKLVKVTPKLPPVEEMEEDASPFASSYDEDEEGDEDEE